MEDTAWDTRLLKNTSKRYQSSIQSRSEYYDEDDDYEEIDIEEEGKDDFTCPFCYEDFDIIGLCCHIDDEHPVEVKKGVCPICGTRQGMDMVGHITTQHGQFFTMQRKRKSRNKGASLSDLSFLKKELRDTSLQFLLDDTSSVVSSSSAAPDPLLSSFIYNLPMIDQPECTQSADDAESISVSESSDENVLERSVQILPMSDKDQEERASRCEFVQGLLLSTMFDDIL